MGKYPSWDVLFFRFTHSKSMRIQDLFVEQGAPLFEAVRLGFAEFGGNGSFPGSWVGCMFFLQKSILNPTLPIPSIGPRLVTKWVCRKSEVGPNPASTRESRGNIIRWGILPFQTCNFYCVIIYIYVTCIFRYKHTHTHVITLPNVGICWLLLCV